MALQESPDRKEKKCAGASAPQEHEQDDSRRCRSSCSVYALPPNLTLPTSGCITRIRLHAHSSLVNLSRTCRIPIAHIPFTKSPQGNPIRIRMAYVGIESPCSRSAAAMQSYLPFMARSLCTDASAQLPPASNGHVKLSNAPRRAR